MMPSKTNPDLALSAATASTRAPGPPAPAVASLISAPVSFSSVQVLCQEAEALFKQKKYEEALVRYNNAFQLLGAPSPTFEYYQRLATIHQGRGQCLAADEKREEAAYGEFKKAIEMLDKIPVESLTPEDQRQQVLGRHNQGELLIQRAERLLVEKKYGDAETTYRLAIVKLKEAASILHKLPVDAVLPGDAVRYATLRTRVLKTLAKSERERGRIFTAASQDGKAIEIFTESLDSFSKESSPILIKEQILSLHARLESRMSMGRTLMMAPHPTHEQTEKAVASFTAAIEDSKTIFHLLTHRIPLRDMDDNCRTIQVKILDQLLGVYGWRSTLLQEQGNDDWMSDLKEVIAVSKLLIQEHGERYVSYVHDVRPLYKVLEKEATLENKRALYNLKGDVRSCASSKDQEKNVPLAMGDYNNSLSIQEDPEVYYSRAHLYRRLGDYKRAIDDFQRAIALQQKEVPIKYRVALANAYWEDGQLLVALEEKNRLLEEFRAERDEKNPSQNPRIDPMVADRLRYFLEECSLVAGRPPYFNAEKLAQFIARNPILEVLGFRWLSISDTDARHLAGALQEREAKGPTLLLHLRGCSLSTAAIVLFAQTVGSFRLNDTYLNDDAVLAIARVMRTSRALWTLDLERCGISDFGIAQLLHALKINKRLIEFELDVKDADAKQIIKDCIARNEKIAANEETAVKTLVPALRFVRANSGNALRTSIIPLLPIMLEFCKSPDPGMEPDAKFNIQNFMDTKYFRAETTNAVVGTKRHQPG